MLTFRTARCAAPYVLVLCLVGCGSGNRASKSPAVSAPTATPVPTPVPQAVVEVFDLKLPPGQVVADLRKDFRGGNNGHPDTSGAGRWFYVASQNHNPLEAGRRVSHLDPLRDKKKAEIYMHSISHGNEPSARPTVSIGNSGAVTLTPTVRGPYCVAARWISGVDGRIAIVDRWKSEVSLDGKGLESFVFVDGIQKMGGPFSADSGVAEFNLETAVIKGSIVDFVAGVDFLQSVDLQDVMAARLDAAIVQLSNDISDLKPSDETIQQVREAFQRAPVRPLPKAADLTASIEEVATRREWLRQAFVGPKAEAAGMNQGEIDFWNALCRQIVNEETAPSATHIEQLGLAVSASQESSPLFVGVKRMLEVRNRGQGLTDQDIAELEQVDAALADKPCSAVAAFWFHALCADNANRLKDANAARQLVKKFSLLAFDDVLRFAERTDLTNHDRQMLLRLIPASLPPAVFDLHRSTLAGRVANSSEIDPWIQSLMLAHEHHHLAWQTRGTGNLKNDEDT